MPTYEYACSSCGEHLEVVQSFKDEPLTECPNCGSPLRKVFGSIGVVFKGSGFYKTDSRTAAKSGKAEKSDKAAESGGKSSEAAAGSTSGKSSEGSSGSSQSSGSSSSSEGSGGKDSSKPSKEAAAS